MVWFDMAAKTETRVVNRIRTALLEAVGGKWFKVHGGPFQEAGLPDLIGCVDGIFFGLEVKVPNDPKSAPTELQLAQLEEYRSEGGIACVIDSPEQAVAIARWATASTPEERGFGRRLYARLRAVVRAADGKDLYELGSVASKRRKRNNARRSKDQSEIDVVEGLQKVLSRIRSVP